MTGREKLIEWIVKDGYMDMLCPSSYGLKSLKECTDNSHSDCEECWKQALEAEYED